MKIARILLLCFGAGIMFLPTSNYAADNPSLESRLGRAHDLLDEYRGNTALLVAARKELEKILEEHPSFAPAYREMARYFIMASVRGRGYEPNHLSAAEAALNRAIEIDPNFADAYVLFGHLYHLMNRTEDAKRALSKAETIGTDSPWLNLNWADILYSENAVAAANARYKAVLDSGTDNFKAIRSARWGLVRGPMRRAEALLNRYSGDKSILEAAKHEIDAALSVEDKVAHLHTLMARYWLAWGFDANTGYSPVALESAEQSLKNAIDLEPMYGEAHLRLVNVYLLMQRPKDAAAALKGAVANGYASPLIEDYLAEISRLEKAANPLVP